MKLCAQSLGRLKELTRRSIVRGRFEFSEGKISPNKVDFEQVSRTCEGQVLMARLIPEILLQRRWFPLDAIGGPDSGALPISIAALQGIGVLPVVRPHCHFFRTAKKEERLLDGHGIRPGSRVVVVDDVATTGWSLLRAVRACREAGAEVIGAFVVVDREEGAEKLLASEGVELASLFRLSDLL